MIQRLRGSNVPSPLAERAKAQAAPGNKVPSPPVVEGYSSNVPSPLAGEGQGEGAGEGHNHAVSILGSEECRQ